MTATIKFCGGAGTVTGSMHLITSRLSRILIDAGLFQGRRDEFYAVNSNFSFNPANLDACVISHAHIDHCGNFPTLVKKGFGKKAYLTPATNELCQYMLPDSGHVQEEDIKYVNKINKRRGQPPREPLYTMPDAETSLKFLKPLEYHRKFKLTKDAELTFFDAGHILGSSIPAIDILTGNGIARLAYAVDLGRANLPYISNPEAPKDIDYLIIESTYGNRTHSDINAAEDQLLKIIDKTISRGGKVIIPSFALERTQEVLYFIAKLLREKEIKKVPVYVDSPLAVNITNVFKKNRQYFDEESRNLFKKGIDPLGGEDITYIEDVKVSKSLHDKSGPFIIISASGTCENGRILHHLKNNIENPFNTVVIVGYMPEHTLGRCIMERHPMVNIFGRPYQLNAEVAVIDAFSAHADKNGLIEYVKACRGKLRTVFIVHGEPAQSEALQKNIKSMGISAVIPKKNEEAYL
jgi:metallo-beta-lactamase family protein